MRWKERFIGDWLSVPVWRLLPRWQKCLLVAGLTASIALALPAQETFLILGIAQLLASGLFVAIRAAGAVTGEREHQTWDSLLTTHMDAYQIVRGKLWGQIDALRPYLLAYLAPALLGALCTDWLAGVWILYTWLASWAFLYYLGAVGISQSLKAASTWRSILITLTFAGYSGRITVLLLGLLLGSGAIGYFAMGLSFAFVDALILAAMVGGLPCFLLIFGGAEEMLLEAQNELKRQTEIGRPPRRRKVPPSKAH